MFKRQLHIWLIGQIMKGRFDLLGVKLELKI